MGLAAPFCENAPHVAVYPVIAAPPFEAGGVKDTVAWPLPGVAVPIVGAPGAPAGVTLTVPEGGPLPAAFVARTVHVTVVPLVRPVTVMGLPAPLADSTPQRTV